MSTPRITVAMTVYNGGKYLRPALQSVLLQQYGDWELLLIDDGSTDGALDLVADLLADPRVRFLRDGLNRGLAARLNEIIDLARGEFIARMDQDDISFPERFGRQLDYLQRHPEVDVVACRCLRISFDDEVVGEIPHAESHADLCGRSWRGIHMAHPSWMGRVTWFRKYRYAQPGPYFCEDQELLLRASPESRYAVLPEFLFAYRVRGSLPWRKTLATRKVLTAIQVRHFVGRRRWGHAVLSLAGFCVNFLRDAWLAASKQAPHDNGVRGEAAFAAARRFAEVLARVRA